MKEPQEKMLTARITHLEMTRRPSKHFPVPSRPTLALLKAENINADFYQFIYEKVGKPHHWVQRRDLKDEALLEIIRDPGTRIHILYADGCPAGFFELDMADLPEKAKISYFGLMPDFQGLGISKWFLNSAIQTAWAEDPQRICVDTNTLDHPAALSLYQKLGFNPFAISEETVEVWL